MTPGFCPKSHTSTSGWDFVAFSPSQDVFHATWASPKWSARWAALTESLEDDVQTSPRHPSSISHVGDLADTCSNPRTPQVVTGQGTSKSWKQAALHMPRPSATVQFTDQSQSSQGACVGPLDRRRLRIQERSERGNFKSRARLTPWTKWAHITLLLHHPTNSAFGLASLRNMARCRSTLGSAR